MSNPLFRGNKGMPSMPNCGMPNGMQAMGNKMQQLRNVIGMIKGGGNPETVLQTLFAQNPQKAQQFNAFLRDGGNPKQFVMDYCQKNNTTPEELMKQLGLKQ